jgi:uncharacterized protein YjiS (DUF1127 family)
MSAGKYPRCPSPQECLYCTAQDGSNGAHLLCLRLHQQPDHQESLMFVTHLIAKIRSYMRYRSSLSALQVLSDRELADIGLTRGTIAAAAWAAAA